MCFFVIIILYSFVCICIFHILDSKSWLFLKKAIQFHVETEFCLIDNQVSMPI